MSLSYNEKLIPLAKKLRKSSTKQEKQLWYDFLSKYPVRFQRQKTIGNYITDFYCSKAKLIIEIDGSQHYSEANALYESERTGYFESMNLTVLRFKNTEIDDDFRKVCDQIDYKVKTLLKKEDEKRN